MVRVFGPAIAKASVPRLFDVLTGSSLMFLFCHCRDTAGSPCSPNSGKGAALLDFLYYFDEIIPRTQRL